MQTIRGTTDPGGTDTADEADDAERSRSGPGRDLTPLLAGAATAVGALGAFLALTGSGSPLRGPFTLFFLLAAPAAAIAVALTGLEPFGRAVASLAGAVVVDMLVAQILLATHHWSVRAGLVAVTVFSALVLLLVPVRRLRGRTPRRQG
ncbi:MULTISPECIES: hypothetical protein [unclassified Streptomyces]|uniref:hypothetical protein n=1 Tax=unclassified Streptomyces TaxID=2593676 RepID=UPI000AF09961|nr:hypothetical protein [Streptomyces sp. TSRI0107]